MRLFWIVPLFFLVSCQQYKIPFVTKEPSSKELLEEYGEGYQRRIHLLKDESVFQRGDQETYEGYRLRIIQTLQMQKHDKQNLKNLIEEKVARLKSLKNQYTHLQAQHIDLRLALNQVEDKSSKVSLKRHSLFQKYQVKEGDTLQEIAKSLYGNYSAWLMIYRFNLETLSRGPNKLEKGDILFLPRITPVIDHSSV